MNTNAINMEKISYKVSMIRYDTAQGHANFIFKVVGPNNISFHIKDRYSSMRTFQSILKKDLDDSVNIRNLPPFPKKRYLNQLQNQFLEQRMAELGRFFNAFLEIPEVARNKLVLTYFQSAPADQDSADKINNLIYLVKKAGEKGDQDAKRKEQ
jgi:hypothetical protein